MRAMIVAAVVGLGALLAGPGAVHALELEVVAPRNDNGTHLAVTWTEDAPAGGKTVILRGEAGEVAGAPHEVATDKVGEPVGDWIVAYAGNDLAFTDEVAPGVAYVYAAAHATKTGDVVAGAVVTPPTAPVTPVAALFNTDRWFYLVLVVLTGVAFWLYLGYARKNAKDIFIRRIPGVDAIEDAIGRSTEMGRPVLYVTGLEEIQDIQTIASLLILGHVAEMTAEYDTDIKVANVYPMTMVVAEEIVRQGYANAGRLDAHRPENVMFITSEQFAFAAAVNGMILRDRPATNIYFGRFFAESLLLAETGFLTGAVQIAGTAEFTQLPFFIAACDYTLLGEELYATSAYLSREPSLLAQLKAGDVVKAFSMVLIVVGAAVTTFGIYKLGPWLMP